VRAGLLDPADGEGRERRGAVLDALDLEPIIDSLSVIAASGASLSRWSLSQESVNFIVRLTVFLSPSLPCRPGEGRGP